MYKYNKQIPNEKGFFQISPIILLETLEAVPSIGRQLGRLLYWSWNVRRNIYLSDKNLAWNI